MSESELSGEARPRWPAAIEATASQHNRGSPPTEPPTRSIRWWRCLSAWWAPPPSKQAEPVRERFWVTADQPNRSSVSAGDRSGSHLLAPASAPSPSLMTSPFQARECHSGQPSENRRACCVVQSDSSPFAGGASGQRYRAPQSGSFQSKASASETFVSWFLARDRRSTTPLIAKPRGNRLFIGRCGEGEPPIPQSHCRVRSLQSLS